LAHHRRTPVGLVAFEGQRFGGVGVQVDDEAAVVLCEDVVDQVGERSAVRLVVVVLASFGLGGGQGWVVQGPTVVGMGVDDSHADVVHLFVRTVEPFWVHDEPGHGVGDPVRCGLPRRRDGGVKSVGDQVHPQVGHEVNLVVQVGDRGQP